MPLFEVAVLTAPSKKEIEDGATEKLIYFSAPPICARNEQSAVLGVAMSDAMKGADLNKITIIVRPFA